MLGARRGRVRAKVPRRHRMGVQRMVAEDPGRPLRDRNEYPREVVPLLLSGAEPQKVVEAVGSTEKPQPVMPAGIERFDDYSGNSLSVPVTTHWRSGRGNREPRPEPPWRRSSLELICLCKAPHRRVNSSRPQ